MRRISQEGIALIQRFEGLKLEAYRCPAGVWTIGYGHTATARKGQRITRAEADQLLMDDLRQFEAGVSAALKRPATDGQFAAFVSLAFNVGLTAFRGSTALRRFNAGDLAGAAEALTWWNKATVAGERKTLPGLVRRREAERALFWADVEDDAEALPLDEPVGPVEGGAAEPAAADKGAVAGVAGVVVAAVTAAQDVVEGLPPGVTQAAPWIMLALFAAFVVVRWRERAAGWR